MNRVIALGCFLLSFSFFTSCFNSTLEDGEVKLITAKEMKSILELEEVQLIDVRTPKEYDGGYIANAQNIDFMSPTFDDDITKLDKNKPVILYCKSGGRSAKCAQKMKAAGFKKIYDLKGGISKWEHSDDIQIQVKS
ncbi:MULTISPECIES: rhodanese-like domain-containing protein [Winogradskyella]|uniref:Rhodanese-related sulfurtransferase n=2 Tax=Winogradskyella TaxID=286104 RepID=A0A368ZEZ5_9FLAO|nr:rhodanese-like domain-containing protein [Winogradskyella arenosi]RCW92101.1 rhodanese-related sulfurtransferase [Winogradskyella arenosi]